MKIIKDGQIVIQTKRREDFRLFSNMDIEYSSVDLEEIVNLILENKDIELNYVFDVLYYYGYELISENDVDQVMLWLKQIFSQYKKEL